MIQMQTILNVADNSGAKKIGCIKVLGGTRKRYAGVGDIIVASVKEAMPNSKVKKGSVVKAVIDPDERRGETGSRCLLNLVRQMGPSSFQEHCEFGAKAHGCGEEPSR